MTETRKQKTIKEKVASENVYQRAAAIWVGRKENKNPEFITDVDFDYESDGWYSSMTPYSGYSALSYSYRGVRKKMILDNFSFTPGQFIEEYVGILKELETIRNN